MGEAGQRLSVELVDRIDSLKLQKGEFFRCTGSFLASESIDLSSLKFISPQNVHDEQSQTTQLPRIVD